MDFSTYRTFGFCTIFLNPNSDFSQGLWMKNMIFMVESRQYLPILLT